MLKGMSRDRVKGFLNVAGTRIVNEDGKEVILTGWGLGNWLLCEGYMWLSDGCGRIDRPRRIEQVVEELTGADYAQQFWSTFRRNYITAKDIEGMAKLGYNSIRVPINYRLFMEEGEDIIWKEEGFDLLDQCVEWCEQFGLYMWIDLHGAPGGQTGANIDDCIDDMPRLFMDEYQFNKGVALWEQLARRYHDRWIIAGYDILNEPLRPKRTETDIDVEYLVPELKRFYEEAIAAIRKWDTRHLISLESHQWATQPHVFCKKYDEKMVIHFHRYGCLPDRDCLKLYQELSRRWNCPLWLGETGEGELSWYTALYPLAAEFGIGYNIWPWKKMDTQNSPCSVVKPADWDKIIAYAKGGKHPGYSKAQEILNEYLQNMLYENCIHHNEITDYVLRRPGSRIMAVDFDELPGRGISYSGLRQEENITEYRLGTGMRIEERQALKTRNMGFDCKWNKYRLIMEKGEYAQYSLHDIEEGHDVRVVLEVPKHVILQIYQDDIRLGQAELFQSNGVTETSVYGLRASSRSTIRIEVQEGMAEFIQVQTR